MSENNDNFPTKEMRVEWKNLIEEYKKVLKINPNLAFYNEEYKWKTITDCKDFSGKQMLEYLIKNKSNLFYATALGNAKELLKLESSETIFADLFDETKDLSERINNYKKNIEQFSSNKQIINDERSASVFLTCKDPQKYTFYKDAYYKKLCEYLKQDKESAGEKFIHYMALIEEFEEVIKNDKELANLLEEKTSNYIQSRKLIAQNIIYTIFELQNGEITMPETNPLVEQLKNNLLHSHNLILHGAPGTGKTYLAKEIAHAMGCTENEIAFVQFHPSYDYTDFVEGLRPSQSEENGNIGFERKDGVFKDFCKRALQSGKTENGVDNFEECWLQFIEKLNEEDFIDIPLLSGIKNIKIELNEYGTGLANRTYEDNIYLKDQWIQGKSKFYSKSQLYNVYRGLPGIPTRGHDNYRKAVIQYMKKNLGLKDYVEPETTSQTKPFVFIIDEINRGEVSKIFGELFYSIDSGYRGEKGKVATQYQNIIEEGDLFKKGFFLPENVYIIGTMNDIDRSVEAMDFAFRRRFAWKEIKAGENTQMLNSLDDDLREKAIACMQNLNKAIYNEETTDDIKGIEGLSSSYHIGASYFLKLNDFEGSSEEKFAQLWDYHLEGLLREYLRGTENIEENMLILKNAYDGEKEGI